LTQRTFARGIVADGAYTLLLRLLNIGAAAALGILTARLLGPSGKGIYALPMVQAGLVTAAFAGLSRATSYFLLNRNAGSRILRPAFVSALAFVAAGAAVVGAIALASGQLWAALPAIASLPSAAAINFVTGYVVGVKRVRYASTLTVAMNVGTFVLMAAGLLAVGRTPSVAIAVWIVASTLISFAALAAVVLHARRLTPSEPVSVIEYLRFTGKVGVVSLISLLNYRADLYIVAWMAPAATLGMYTVAVSAAESLLVPTQVAALVTSPHVGGLDLQAAGQLTARCVRNNFLVAAVVCGVIFALAQPIVHLLYGSAFLPLVPALRVLLLGVFALSLGSPMSNYFTLKLGKPEVAMVFASISAAVCIAVSIVLVPRLGMLGAAIGSTAAYALGQAVATVYFSRMAHIPIQTILVPTLGDLTAYRDLLRLRMAPR